MKSLITLAVLVFSVNSFAFSIADSTNFITSISDITTNGLNICKEAAAVIEDANAFNATGVASPALAAHIKSVQLDSEVSDQEAVDILVEQAQIVLSNN